MLALPAVLVLVLRAGAALAAYPYANHVENYTPGDGVEAAYTNAQVALGQPSLFSPSPWGAEYDSVVSMVSPACLGTQLVQLGAGGSLTVRFDQPIVDSPSNLYGADLIVFGNSLFAASWPDGTLNTPATLFDLDAGKIEVSADGVNFLEVPGAVADRFFPTQAYLDAAPFAATAGNQLANFQKPMNPALTLADFSGLTFAQALALYDGSGGGTPVDIAAAIDAQGLPAGLTSVSYVRITNAGTEPMEIDAFSAVPEPVTALLLPLALALAVRRTKG